MNLSTALLSSADRVNDYQHYAVDAVQSCSQYSDMGAQVTHTELLAGTHTAPHIPQPCFLTRLI